MKRILLSLFSLFCIASSYAVSLNGVEYTIDTLSMFQAGPGTTYYELRFLRADNGKNRMDGFLLAVDTRNPYVTVEQVLGTGKIIGTERPSAMATRSTTENKIFFAGSNGDFFVTQGDVGLPTNTTIVNKEYAHTPAGVGASRRLGCIDADGRGATAYYHSVSMQLVLADTTLNIAHANYKRLENELVLYNIHNGSTTGTNAYGAEVQIQLLNGQEWNTTGTMKAKVTKVEDQVGSMPLDKDHAVLSAHGTMATELKKLSVGDELTLNFEMRLDDELVNVAQSIGSENYVQILQDGKVAQSGYWNELHPRTGFGVSQTRDTVYMLVVDGRSTISAGCNTRVLAEMLQHFGAYDAVNWDGGGSSCIYVRPFGPMNNGSDGQERACGNGMFAVANVPETDNTIVSIAPYMPNYYLPRYGVAAPQFLGYNKYGVLVETNVPGVQLSCAPEVGEILPDGRFLASGEKGGKLKATWGDVTTELDVRIVASASIAIRLDSVICDSYHPYAIEVIGAVGNNVVEVLSSALTWTSADPTIASVNEKGEVVGLKNGTTVITGKLGDFEDKIVVVSQVAAAEQMLWDDFRQTSTWELTEETNYGAQLTVPESASAPVNLIFKYTNGRIPLMTLSKDSLFYSKPEKILIPMNTAAAFDKIIVTMRANNSNEAKQVAFLNPPVGETALDVDVKSVFGDDVSIFPLHFSYMQFYPSKSNEKKEYNITLPGIIQVFKSQTSEVESTTYQSSNAATKYVKDGVLLIQSGGNTYDVLGTQITK